MDICNVVTVAPRGSDSRCVKSQMLSERVVPSLWMIQNRGQ